MSYNIKIMDITNPVKKEKRIYFYDSLYHLRKLMWILFSGFILFSFTHTVYGQSGKLIGNVTDIRTGKALDGVEVEIQGVTSTSVTNRDGRFSTTDLPEGRYRLLLTATGFLTLDTTVVIGSISSRNLDFVLVPDFNTREDRHINALRLAQAQVYARQKKNSEMSHAVSSVQMIRDGDHTIQNGLTRLPGVQVGRRGELNIRGVGRDMFEVTVDGLRMASSTPATRYMNPGSFSAALTQDVEIVKVLSPNMDAEGIGGVVRINTWRPIGKREITVNTGGMANPRYSAYTGLGSIASINYAERYRNDFAMSVNVSYMRDVNGFDGLEIDYAAQDFGGGFVDVIPRLSPAMRNTQNDYFGSTIQFSYQPNEISSFYVQALMSSFDNKNASHSYVYLTGNDWINQTTTGRLGSRGSLIYDASLRDGSDLHFTVQTGGEHLLNILKVEYKAGWSNRTVDNSQYYFPFITGNLNYDINMDDRTRPTMTITNSPLMDDGTIDRRFQNFQNLERTRDEHQENRYSARLDLSMILGNVNIKFGTSGLWTSRGRGYTDEGISTLRRYDLMRFETVARGSFDVMDRYTIPWIVYPENIAIYVNTNKPDLRINAENILKRSEIWNNSTFEGIYGAYGMTEMNFGRFTFSGGIRMEYTDGKYEGSKVSFNRFDSFISSKDTSATVGYLNFFPNAQFTFTSSSNSRLKLAYSRSIKRHHYSILTPFELISAIDTTRFRGTPDLSPAVSDNLDIYFEQYLGGIGVFTAGAFYKEISNLVSMQEGRVRVSEFPFLTVAAGNTIEVTERYYLNNNESAKIYGFELSWQQYLNFLPGFLGDLGVYANYTWTHSVDDQLSRNGEDFALLYQSPHVVNAMLDYYRGRFSGSIAWHWSAASLYRPASVEQWAPALDKSKPIYLDWYEDGWTDVSASFGFRFSSNFRFWANAKNLLGKERILYGGNRGLYPFSTDLNSGLHFTAGLTFSI
jgi:TonB-dependent receptor